MMMPKTNPTPKHRLRDVFQFSEFDPNHRGPDWKIIAWRMCLLAGIVVIPTALALLQFLYRNIPVIAYMMAGVAALYLPALALMRKPKVTVTSVFEIRLLNPKTIDAELLVRAACSAVAYFILLIFGVLAVWR